MVMEFISIPVVVGMISYAIYKLFELYARRKERLNIIEKMDFSRSNSQIDLNIHESNGKFLPLKLGCLFAGIGLGLLVGFMISSLTCPSGFNADEPWRIRETAGMIYGASVFIFGGIGLIISFIIERWLSKK